MRRLPYTTARWHKEPYRVAQILCLSKCISKVHGYGISESMISSDEVLNCCRECSRDYVSCSPQFIYCKNAALQKISQTKKSCKSRKNMLAQRNGIWHFSAFFIWMKFWILLGFGSTTLPVPNIWVKKSTWFGDSFVDLVLVRQAHHNAHNGCPEVLRWHFAERVLLWRMYKADFVLWTFTQPGASTKKERE